MASMDCSAHGCLVDFLNRPRRRVISDIGEFLHPHTYPGVIISGDDSFQVVASAISFFRNFSGYLKRWCYMDLCERLYGVVAGAYSIPFPVDYETAFRYIKGFKSGCIEDDVNLDFKEACESRIMDHHHPDFGSDVLNGLDTVFFYSLFEQNAHNAFNEERPFGGFLKCMGLITGWRYEVVDKEIRGWAPSEDATVLLSDEHLRLFLSSWAGYCAGRFPLMPDTMDNII